MAWRLSKDDGGSSETGNGRLGPEINVLASEANWAWPEAIRAIFKPRGINLLMAQEATEFVHIIERQRIHTAILDMDTRKFDALATIKVIRLHFPLLPCLLLTSSVDQETLGKALQLNVFSVIGKPVDMRILRERLDRLFVKRYDSRIFAE